MNETPTPTPPPAPRPEPADGGTLAALLRRPGAAPPLPRLAVVTLVGAALYGLAAGFFAGGAQVVVAALKAPLVVAAALALCTPSFVVFHLVAGEARTAAELARTVAAFGAVAALFLAALTPIGWLFSVTSRSLAFVALFHLALWGLALAFGLRHLFAALRRPAARAVSLLWSVLFWFVAVQLATYLGPILVREPTERLFPLQRGSFVERFEETFRWDSRQGEKEAAPRGQG